MFTFLNRRIGLVSVTAGLSCLLLILLLSGVFSGTARRALAQRLPRPTANQQTLVIGYPTQGIVISGDGANATRYKGIVYVKVFPAGSNTPVATAELTPSQRDLRVLSLGTYEIHFAMRVGSEMKTFILRDVILRADRAVQITVEMNADAKTTIVGGDMTAQQMADSIRTLQAEVTALRRQIADMKK